MQPFLLLSLKVSFINWVEKILKSILFRLFLFKKERCKHRNKLNSSKIDNMNSKASEIEFVILRNMNRSF